MMNPPPHFIERRILLILSCHDSKGTQHCGWCSNSTLPLPALSLFRGVQETGWPALICPTMSNYVQLCATMSNYVQLCPAMSNYVQLCATIISKRWKSSHTILHGRTKRATNRVAPSSYMCNETTSTFRDNSPTRLRCMQQILCNKRNTTFKRMIILLNPNCSQGRLLYSTK